MMHSACFAVPRLHSIYVLDRVQPWLYKENLLHLRWLRYRVCVQTSLISSRMVSRLSKCDPNSFSNPDQCAVNDVHLNLKVDFEKQILSGYADISFERKDPKADAVIFDTKNLKIHNVRNRNTMKKMTYNLESPVLCFGSKLEVKLPKTVTKRYTLRIDYETSPEASALQWLEPQQTCGKVHPYMFSHSEAIHGRSMLPCQDTPCSKATYSASITTPSSLVALMSAVRDGEDTDVDAGTKTYKFVQKVPIPSYLIAIAVGDLVNRKIGPRTHVWSEKEFVDKAAFEFDETEKMLQLGEKLLGPYVWEVYDLLVLPPSFPFGGMENPCLTFVTPTLLAGDKSLADVVAHEIAHSWTGNLVTNSNFEHFWLNEGFTMFLERKIVGRMHGEAFRHFSSLGGWKELAYEIGNKGKDNPLTKLVPDLTGIDPDDAFSVVPYEKGYTFLFYLEEMLGGAEIFEEYLRAYIEKYKERSIDTKEWKSFLYEHFQDKKDMLEKVDWEAWLNTPGMPPVKPKYDTSLSDKCSELCKSWVEADLEDLEKFAAKDFEQLSSPEKIEFLALLLEKKPLSVEKMKKMTELYELEKITNSEIRFRWLRLGLLARWNPITPHVIKFVTEQGRMKYVRPLYRDMYDWEETKELAISTYKKHHQEMMYVAAYGVGKDLHLENLDINSK